MTHDTFFDRHVGLSDNDVSSMLDALGLNTLDELINQTIPESIRFNQALAIESGTTEQAALAELKQKMSANISAQALIGQGYHGCHTPPVILRNLFENPGWYTSYTPYQPEISQGRLEMLFHFQTLISELTGLPIANSSLLDEGTAIAEAIAMAARHHRNKRLNVVIANSLHPQSLSVIETRCQPLNLNTAATAIDESTAAVVIQMPDTHGEIADHSALIAQAKAVKALVIFSSDPMALLLLKKPADLGADIVVGCIQRYGVPMGNGGPHAAFMAATEAMMRLIPGRIIGQSVDSKGRLAYRLALQTREQHIRREKANSNICTAQALLANMAAAYAIWHGPKRLINIATRINQLTATLATAVKQQADYTLENQQFFDTLSITTKGNAKALCSNAEQQGLLLRCIDENRFSITLDETSDESTLASLATALNLSMGETLAQPTLTTARGSEFLSQPAFHAYRCETAMMRYLKTLTEKDLALDKAMIPLGSCTMKLNAAAEMIPVSWESVANIHPYAPASHRKGYDTLVNDLDRWLSEITGFAKVEFQPNAGSQGEFLGLLSIKQYLTSIGQGQRNVCIIPSSAHGTNPASAQVAGMKVVVVKCDASGNVDLADLQAKVDQHANDLAALMITYPSTHGVFEESIKTICEIIHQAGGQVYLDGANLNALVGLSRPADLGADVCHMNLHKTFCIPHGGGGPGIGPIGVAQHLIPFLPGDITEGDYMVSAAPQGSASILPISWMYIRMLGAEGLKKASEYAILSANYLAKAIDPSFPVLYKGSNGFVAHECIIDTRVYKAETGIDVEDIAKRLIDYGFHAPTMSWPVIGTLMVEPTESEPKPELDRFIAALTAIHAEIQQIKSGQWTQEDNPVANAPHPLVDILSNDWDHAYPREVAATTEAQNQKFWPTVSRVDNVSGDRNLVCTCPPLSSYESD